MNYPNEVGENPGLYTGVEAEVPTWENSTMPRPPQLDPSLDSEPKVADASC